jgi:prepilin-type N-terminal cleavage/methylation domain-containing protein
MVAMRQAWPRSKSALLRSRSRGFTLVELMTVVLITGVLATIGISLVRGHMNAAKANRALTGLQAIRVAEEAFRAQNGQYIDCSPGDTPRWFPMEVPGKIKYEWHQSDHADWPRWQALGVANDADGTQYGFLVNAGNPGGTYPKLYTTGQVTLPASPDPWFVIQAKGDLDGNGVFMQAVASSFTNDVYVERESE